jgi:chromosome segregation ATPase
MNDYIEESQIEMNNYCSRIRSEAEDSEIEKNLREVKLYELENEIKEMRINQLRNLEKQKNQFQKQLERSESQHISLEKHLNQKIKTLESQNNMKIEENEDLKIQLEKKVKIFEYQNVQLKNSKRQIDGLKIQEHKHKQMILNLTENISKKATSLDIKNKNPREVKEENEKLKEKIINLQNAKSLNVVPNELKNTKEKISFFFSQNFRLRIGN